jgi:transcriptional regulator with XRE-family HTH domain
MGTSNRRGTVTEEHRAESRKLKELYESTPHGLSQAAFGATYGIGNQGAVWQFLNGKTALSMDAAKGFAKGLGVPLSDFSPRLAREAEEIAEVSPRKKPPSALSFLELKADEVRLIGLFRDLKPAQKIKLETIANEMYAASHPTKPTLANPYPTAPVPPASPGVARALKAFSAPKKESKHGSSDQHQGVQRKRNGRGSS